MMKQTNKRGFTLIELLVVIAIIGILASVVLVSINIARDKGTNSAIKSNLSSVRTQAQLYFDNSNSLFEVTDGVDSVCVNGLSASVPGIADNVAAAVSLNNAGLSECNDDATSYAVAVQLVGLDSGSYFCVDSLGFSGEIVGTIGVEFASGALVCS